ncbi:MAG: hypothetical protein HFH23_17665 [Ruminococcus sp.]|nr:hypothetical protein [Ruminococcus sp.]
MVTEWIRCPICGNKTRNKIREETILKNYPLYLIPTGGFTDGQATLGNTLRKWRAGRNRQR